MKLSFFETHIFQNLSGLLAFALDFIIFLIKAPLYDAVHFHASSNSSFFRKFLFFLWAKALRKEIYLHLHSGGFFEFLDRSPTAERLFRFFLKGSDKVIVVSNWFLRQLQTRYRVGVKAVVIPNSSPEFEKLGASPKELTPPPYVLFAGSLTEQKGLLDLIDAMAILCRRGLTIRLVCAGEGNIDFWKKYALARGAEDVQFLGWVTGEAKADLYLECSIFCLPSHFESFGISVLEAMLVGKPVVCTALGGLLDLVEPNISGFLVEKSCPMQIADCIERLIKDPSLAVHMGREGYFKALRSFSSESMMEKTLSIYKDF
ncbi:glycosyltransferase family 4 protein [Pseudomonas sp. RL]|uniref:glycosyltransferase family 4 protein n=1 Tax=Pseudomonas sp. RL TaxID=1452718 RepID=UPI00138E290C|nr:glycosyltransferase family 4 protein [Pseudomonas sp. RL]